ncbi:MAG: hypothetical protein GXP31_19030 [Kiritimatiellaeota bacterium]|nr:hypothetical protein [Kiritimatiellota bacterium]
MHSRIFFLVIALVGASRLSVRGDSSSYDDAVALGTQLAVNGSFEDDSRDGKVAGWGATSSNGPTLVSGVATAHHGWRAFRFDGTKGRRRLWGKLNAIVTGPVCVSAWVKGRGRLEFVLTAVRNDFRLRKGAARWNWREYKVQSVNSPDAWTQVVWRTTIPEDLDQSSTKHIGFEIAGSGGILVDETTVTRAGMAPPRPGTEAEEVRRAADINAAPRPILTVPFMRKPPVIDGKMAPGEWDAAAAVTGFVTLSSKTLSSRQTTVFVGYTSEGLYVAFRCPHSGKFMKGEKLRDSTGGHQAMENVEIWLVPADTDTWYQFYGNPAGLILDQRRGEGLAWNAPWSFANHVQTLERMTGGILLFDRHLWTSEIFVPFSAFGRDTPKPGETWRANFCRDFSVKKGTRRKLRDWTTWSPVTGSFKSLGNFGRLVFQPHAPAVQWTEVGDLAAGQLSISGRVTNGETTGLRISARAVDAASNRTLSIKAGEPGPDGHFALSDRLRVNRRTEALYQVRVMDAVGTKLLESTVGMVAETALRARVVPIFKDKFAWVSIDARNLPKTAGPVSARVDILGADRQVVKTLAHVWTKSPLACDLRFGIRDFPPGKYDAKVQVSAGGDVIGATATAFDVIEDPEWLGNTLGVSDVVPAPWTPLKVRENGFSVSGREYRLNRIGLPHQVTVQGRPLFAAAPRLRLKTAGGEHEWSGDGLKLVSNSPAEAKWTFSAAAAGLLLTGVVTAEFDGFVLWDVTVKPVDKPVRVEALALEFPFAAERALYARGKNAMAPVHAGVAALLDVPPKVDSVQHSVWYFNRTGWAWPEDWFHELWIGDDERGFSVMCETQQYLFGKKRTEVRYESSRRTAVIHLIDGEHLVRTPLTYQYMFQATPVIPWPKDPKRWHVAYHAGTQPETLEQLYAVCDYWALKYQNYPSFRISRNSFLHHNKSFLEHGVRVVPYYCTHRVSSCEPTTLPFVPEWEVHPVRIITELQGPTVTASPISASLRDFHAWSVNKLVADLGFGGVYLDVSSVTASSNLYQGSGYVRDGIRRPTCDIRNTRKLYKRLYNVLRLNGRRGVMFRHGMPVAAVAGFVDYVTEGEGWGRTGNRQYDDLTPEEFRAVDMRVQRGVPYGWYCFHQYYRGIATGGRVPVCQILAYTLPHRVLPCLSVNPADKLPPGATPVTLRIWKAMDPWISPANAEFLPYWRPGCPVVAEGAPPNVLVSVYRRAAEKRALVVAANWNRAEKAVRLLFDTAALGFGRGGLEVSRALKHPIVFAGERQRDGDKMENSPLVLKSNRLDLAIGPRNLEMILVQPRAGKK